VASPSAANVRAGVEPTPRAVPFERSNAARSNTRSTALLLPVTASFHGSQYPSAAWVVGRRRSADGFTEHPSPRTRLPDNAACTDHAPTLQSIDLCWLQILFVISSPKRGSHFAYGRIS
jgi:hypothetical protein